MSEQQVSVFISYAHEDDAERTKLRRHLRTVRTFDVWDDREIPAGSEWNDDISDALGTADIVLLLVSVDFITSEYVQKVEIPRAIDRHNEETSRVIPVLLKPCNWKETGIDHLNALPADEKWVEEWSSMDKALLNVVEGVKEAAAGLVEARRHHFENREQYRRKVAEALSDDHISIGERDTLDEELVRLGLSAVEAAEIEAGETQTIDEKRTNQGRYRSTVAKVVAKGVPITDDDQEELKKRREYLGLTDADIVGIEDEEIEKWSDVERRDAAARTAAATAERDAAEREAAQIAEREAAERATAEREAAERATAEREAAEREVAETAKREAAERATAEREAAERETARLAAEAEAQAAESERRRAAAAAAGNADAIAWATMLAELLDDHAGDLEDALMIGDSLSPEIRSDVVSTCALPSHDTPIGVLRFVGDESKATRDVVFGVHSLYVGFGDESVPAAHSYSDVSDDMVADDTVTPIWEGDFEEVVQMHATVLLADVRTLIMGNEATLDALRQDLTARANDFDVVAELVHEEVRYALEARHAYRAAWVPAMQQLLGESNAALLSVAPDISNKKMRNAFERYDVPSSETALGILDTTVFGSAKDGLMFALDGVYMHNPYGSMPGAHHVPYAAMSPFGIGIDPDASGEVGIGEVCFTTSSAPRDALLLLDVVRLHTEVCLDLNGRLASETPDSIERQRAFVLSLNDAVMMAMYDEDAPAVDTQSALLLDITKSAVEAHPDRTDLLLDRAGALRVHGIITESEGPLREAFQLLDTSDADVRWSDAVTHLKGLITDDLAEM